MLLHISTGEISGAHDHSLNAGFFIHSADFHIRTYLRKFEDHGWILKNNISASGW